MLTTLCINTYTKSAHTSCILKIPVKSMYVLNNSQKKLLRELEVRMEDSRQKRKKELCFVGGFLKAFVFESALLDDKTLVAFGDKKTSS